METSLGSGIRGSICAIRNIARVRACACACAPRQMIRVNLVRSTAAVWRDGELTTLIRNNLAKDGGVKIRVTLMTGKASGRSSEASWGISQVSGRACSCRDEERGNKFASVPHAYTCTCTHTWTRARARPHHSAFPSTRLAASTSRGISNDTVGRERERESPRPISVPCISVCEKLRMATVFTVSSLASSALNKIRVCHKKPPLPPPAATTGAEQGGLCFPGKVYSTPNKRFHFRFAILRRDSPSGLRICGCEM